MGACTDTPTVATKVDVQEGRVASITTTEIEPEVAHPVQVGAKEEVVS